MEFTYNNQHESQTKFTKVALVGLLHVALGYGLVHSLSKVNVHFDHPIETMLTLTPEKPLPPPPPPKEPPKPKVAEAPKPVPIPKPVVDVPPPPEPVETVQAQVTSDPAPADPAPAQPAAAPASDSGTPGNIGTAVMADGCATPEYPAKAARMGETGTTSLALLVGTDGHVQSAKVQSSSGSRELDRAAVQALSMCKFKPGMAGNGQPQAGWARLDYVWKLDS